MSRDDIDYWNMNANDGRIKMTNLLLWVDGFGGGLKTFVKTIAIVVLFIEPVLLKFGKCLTSFRYDTEERESPSK